MPAISLMAISAPKSPHFLKGLKKNPALRTLGVYPKRSPQTPPTGPHRVYSPARPRARHSKRKRQTPPPPKSPVDVSKQGCYLFLHTLFLNRQHSSLYPGDQTPRYTALAHRVFGQHRSLLRRRDAPPDKPRPCAPIRLPAHPRVGLGVHPVLPLDPRPVRLFQAADLVRPNAREAEQPAWREVGTEGTDHARPNQLPYEDVCHHNIRQRHLGEARSRVCGHTSPNLPQSRGSAAESVVVRNLDRNLGRLYSLVITPITPFFAMITPFRGGGGSSPSLTFLHLLYHPFISVGGSR